MATDSGSILSIPPLPAGRLVFFPPRPRRKGIRAWLGRLLGFEAEIQTLEDCLRVAESDLAAWKPGVDARREALVREFPGTPIGIAVLRIVGTCPRSLLHKKPPRRTADSGRLLEMKTTRSEPASPEMSLWRQSQLRAAGVVFRRYRPPYARQCVVRKCTCGMAEPLDCPCPPATPDEVRAAFGEDARGDGCPPE